MPSDAPLPAKRIAQQIEDAIQEVYEEVLLACNRAWATPPMYAQSPIELIGNLIEERDEARQLAHL